MFDPVEQEKMLRAFLDRHVRPYDPEADDYDRPPFAADIKEGKNDPIYNAHSYHTKVPPRSIIPYVLHYTRPGDLILDPFCGSGMTGVAAQMCANPPADILEQFPELKDRVGPRACVLNDLSPAACHIAYNYNTPVDVEAFTREFERIKVAVKGELDWLYGTEHYEPALGIYQPDNPDVRCRLKNPPKETEAVSDFGLMALDGCAQTNTKAWELLSTRDVEERLGYPVTELPYDDSWGKLDVATVTQWVCISATIQYAIWSDVYRCEGFLTIEEPTGKTSKRGKNAGRPIFSKKRAARGCGKEVALWQADGELKDGFLCPHCNQRWTTEQATWLRTEPTLCILAFPGITVGPKRQRQMSTVVRRRPFAQIDHAKLLEIQKRHDHYWYPTTKLVPGEEGNRLINCGIDSVDGLYTTRNLRALAAIWKETLHASDPRMKSVLQFLFTSVSVGLCSKLTRYNFGKRGNGAMAARLFMPHFQCEANVLKVVEGKFADLRKYFARLSSTSDCVTLNMPAQSLSAVPSNSVDFVFADPPFGRNIAYSELNILWEAWLGAATDVAKEAITSNARRWDNESYNAKMAASFVEMYRILKPGRYAMIEFNNRDPELFEAIKSVAVGAGFVIRNMLLLDKDQKTFKQVQGVLRGEGTLDKDVIFNIEKPNVKALGVTEADLDVEQQVADAVRQHLQSLPERIKGDPSKYNDEHRTTATLNSMLMNALIPRGVDVQRINLLLIERVCSRYFRKVGQRWYLRGEAVGGADGSLVQEEVTIKDEVTAIAWLRQRLESGAALVGELKSLWMRATGLLPTSVSQSLVLEDLLISNFWRDESTNRWREPTPAERERMNDDKSIRVLHDAERCVAGSLRRETADAERCEWIDALFQMCRDLESDDAQMLPSMRELASDEVYRLIGRLFQGVLKDKVPPGVYSKATKQAGVASQRIAQGVEDKAEKVKAKKRAEEGPTLFDL
jgi:hypothetical protein